MFNYTHELLCSRMMCFETKLESLAVCALRVAVEGFLGSTETTRCNNLFKE